jgi:hypothetical protein
MATIKDSIEKYLEFQEARSGRVPKEYRFTLNQFLGIIGNKPLADVTKQDLTTFLGNLRVEGSSDRTCHNKISEVSSMLRHFGINDVNLSVKYQEKAVRSYREDEVKSLMVSATPDERLVFSFFLVTAGRSRLSRNRCSSFSRCNPAGVM